MGRKGSGRRWDEGERWVRVDEVGLDTVMDDDKKDKREEGGRGKTWRRGGQDYRM